MPSDTPFSDLAQVNPPRPALDPRDLDPVSFIPMGNVSESGRWTEQQSRPYGEVRRGYTYCAEGDVLFAKITPCTENGKGCHAIELTNGVGFASTEFHVLRAKEGVDPGYIFQWSVNLPLRLNAAAHMTGSAGQQRVPAAFFSRFAVPKLPLPEQSKIAEVLSTVDWAIEQTEALIAKHQRIKTGLMQDLLTRGIDEHGNLRSEQTHEFKDSPLGRIPVEWECKELSQVLVQRPRNGLYKPASLIGRGTLLVGQTSFTQDRRLDFLLCRRAVVSPSEIETFGLDFGDILVTRVFATVDGVGQPVLVDSPPEPAVYESNMLLLRPAASIIDSLLLFTWLRSAATRRGVLCSVNASNQVSVNQMVLKSLPVPVPSISEQERISQALGQMDAAVRCTEVSLQKLRLLKTGLMQNLLTGERRVTALLESPKELVNA